VTLGEEVPGGAQVPGAQRLDHGEDSGVLGDDVPGSPPQRGVTEVCDVGA
jgi:hypothetical protein